MARKRGQPYEDIIGQSIMYLYFFVFSLYVSVNILEDWRYTPDHLTDKSLSLFSGVMFMMAGALSGTIACQWRSQSLVYRIGLAVSVVLMLMFPLWSAGMTYLRFSTISRYENNPQLGICQMRGSRKNIHTDIYVPDTDWCRVKDIKIKRPSPEKP